MNTQKLTEALDKQIEAGEILEAFEAYFHPKVVTHHSPTDRSTSKTEKRNRLKSFLSRISNINTIKLHSSASNGNISLSEFTFEFTHTNGTKTVWNEVIRRVWQDDLVIDEKYYVAEPTEETIITNHLPKKVTKTASVRNPTPLPIPVPLPTTNA
jgi:hypothetical protein